MFSSWGGGRFLLTYSLPRVILKILFARRELLRNELTYCERSRGGGGGARWGYDQRNHFFFPSDFQSVIA